MGYKVYRFIIKVTDLTVKSISEGRFIGEYEDSMYGVGVLDPYGTTGYQIDAKDLDQLKARQQVVKMLKDMGFKVLPSALRW